MKSFLLIFVVIFGGILIDTANGDLKVNDGYDPGQCDKSNHAEQVLVKDRENSEMVLTCADNDGVYEWRAIAGSILTGEFLNPGYDCSDILDKDMKAKDGFYWVQFDSNTPKKVWCDMTTDGGGFMLIGHKNNSITWSIPSNDNPVEPLGYPHWSSALGDSPVLDFRVQMSTGGDFTNTKSHWSFTFNGKRPLKNLMIMGEKGCDRGSPGIGDIAYVKNLQTEEIVTTTFRCSQFGIGHHQHSKLGWSMMNSCLQKPCPLGFAYHHKYPIQVDYSGAFSYSVVGEVSGIVHNATAFLGCNDGHCCGCYGPVGGKDDYCSKECKPINGGTVTTNVYTWFWVRSALPKKVWNKCMEYKVTKANGDIVWNKLTAGNVVSTEGRCVQTEALLNDGIVVVPDADTAKKVPSVVGLMAYRQDNKELYIRSNDTWKVIAQEKKVMNTFNEKFVEYNKKFENITQTLRMKLLRLAGVHLSASVILQGKQNYVTQLEQWLSPKSNWHLCYRASRDGWRSMDFHSRCDFKGPTVTIVKVGKYIFGGYSNYQWGGCGCYRSSSSSFIFSLENKDNLQPFKARVYRNSNNAIYTNDGYGPTFGGHDLHISNNANSNTNSFTNLGHTYQLPSGYSYTSSNTRALLAGSYHFSPSEVEVFYLR